MIIIRQHTYTGGLELDLRKEMNRTLHGASDEIPKGALDILRRMRWKEGVVYPVTTADLQICPCKSESIQNEPDKDYPCDICFGEGYLFDDEIVVAYKTNRFEFQDVEKYNRWGKNTIAMSFFYIESYRKPNRFDKLLEPVHTIDGKISSPIKILHTHAIHMSEEFRSDNGRVEFWRTSCFTD